MGKYNIHINDLAEVPHGFLKLSGTYSYNNRIASLHSAAPDRQYKSLRQATDKTGIIGFVIEQLKREIIDYSTFTPGKAESVDKDSRYLPDLVGVATDRFNTIEMTGGMTYSKGFSLIYSLHDKLDFALSYLFNTELETVRSRLLANCKEYGYDYLKVSYAFCNHDAELIKSIDLRCMIGISEVLDLKLWDIVRDESSCHFKIGDTVLNLAGKGITEEERVTAYLISKISFFNHLILNIILKLFEDDVDGFEVSSERIPTSVGHSNIVIACKQRSLPCISISLGDTFVLELPAHTVFDLGEKNEGNWYNNNG